jgi:hypothetical protein
MTTQNRIAITGNTYPVKEQLKALGAKWNADQKAWMVTEDKAQAAQAIVANAGPKKAFTGTRTATAARSFGARRSTRYCDECGELATPGTRCWEMGFMH